MQDATNLLAFSNMKTLYLRNVPDDIVERLERLAKKEGTSVSAVAIRGLADISWRADVELVLADLPNWHIPTARILADLDEGRAER